MGGLGQVVGGQQFPNEMHRFAGGEVFQKYAELLFDNWEDRHAVWCWPVSRLGVGCLWRAEWCDF